MYSPKIAEDLIHPIYLQAKAAKMPMTRFVSGILRNALANMNTADSTASDTSSLYVSASEPQKQAAA